MASPSPEPSTEIKADIRSSSALASTRQNLKYLIDPSSTTAPRPARFRTRALLRSLRFFGTFVFWRVVRYAKFALIGLAVSAIGATAFGGLVSGVGFVLAPPGILASIAVGTAWTVGKYALGKMTVGEKAVAEGKRAKKPTTVDGSWRDVQGPQANPW